MNRIELKFKQLKSTKKKAFIAFITAGYPSLKITEELIIELERIGVDIIELGVSFSDPMADGPVIQEASTFALRHNTHLNAILRLVKKVRRYVDIPICLMTYYNPVFHFTEERFVKECIKCGVDGVIIPDLPPEEAKFFIDCADKNGLDTIFFLSPTSTLKRIRFISALSSGFIYYVSLTGVTGARRDLPADIFSHLKLIKKNTKKPLCVGFGVSQPEQVRQIYKVADGVIVGSAIIAKIKDNIGRPDLVKRVSAFLRKLLIKPNA